MKGRHIQILICFDFFIDFMLIWVYYKDANKNQIRLKGGNWYVREKSSVRITEK